jgi:hypothetical protein
MPSLQSVSSLLRSTLLDLNSPFGQYRSLQPIPPLHGILFSVHDPRPSRSLSFGRCAPQPFTFPSKGFLVIPPFITCLLTLRFFSLVEFSIFDLCLRAFPSHDLVGLSILDVCTRAVSSDSLFRPLYFVRLSTRPLHPIPPASALHLPIAARLDSLSFPRTSLGGAATRFYEQQL